MRQSDAGATGPRDEPSPLDVMPGLADLARVMVDAVAVTDLHRRVVLWNDASVALYGIAPSDALGRPVDALFDSTIVGQEVTPAGARIVALERGTWRGRVIDRPTIGSRKGQELVIETALSRIDAPDGRPAGVLSVKRDVTEGVRLERELAAIGSLVTATGEARSREMVAARALGVAMTATRATVGVIAVPAGRSGRVLAAIDAPDTVQRLIAEIDWAESPSIRAVTPIGRVVKGRVDRLPLSPPMRAAILGAGVHGLLIVALHREGRLVGVLTLGWAHEDPVFPSDGSVLLIAAQIARGLEDARLVEEIVRRAESERATTTRLRALDDLTRVGGSVTTLDELAARSGRLINTALGAAGTAYGLLTPEGDAYATTSFVDVRPPIEAWLREQRPDVRSAFRRWRAGEGAFIEPFEVGVVPAPYVDLAREAGVTAYAAIPIRVDDVVVGGIVAYFDRPLTELHLDRDALERVASIASISLANFQLRERLVGSERRYRTLFEASPDAMLVTLEDGAVVDTNAAATRLFRAEREWMLGRRPLELGSFDRTALRRQVDGLRVGESLTVHVTGRRHDGEAFPADLQITRVELGGEPRLLARVRDLTEQERLQAELIQAQKMEATGQLVSGVAHELNNPLAAILGFSQLIRRDPSLPEDLRHNADLLVEEATRTRRIVQNLLDFARQRAPERHPTSIGALVDSVLALQTYSLSRGLIKVEVDVPPDLPLVELDRSQIQQVLVNLTHNAIYAIREGGGGRIHIAATREGADEDERVRITVMDDGPGVAPEHVARLFEAFFTTKPPADGTGLGLPVSYGIVRSHGGELRYQPSAFERGAAFTFDLPVRTIADPEEAARTAPPAPAMPVPEAPVDAVPVPVPAGASRAAPGSPDGRPRVLVLDDEASIRTFLDKALRALGYDPVMTSSGAEAIERIGEGDFAALLCDHQMVGLTGIDVHEAVVRTRPDLVPRYVLMSGDVLNPAIATFAASQQVGLLAKPFDLETLDRTIRLAMGGPAADEPAASAGD